VSAKEIPDMYASHQWSAVVTPKSAFKRSANGLIVNVTDDGFTVRRSDGSEETYRHDEVLEIYPEQRP
jgi:hypothetical protein